MVAFLYFDDKKTNINERVEVIVRTESPSMNQKYGLYVYRAIKQVLIWNPKIYHNRLYLNNQYIIL